MWTEFIPMFLVALFAYILGYSRGQMHARGE